MNGMDGVKKKSIEFHLRKTFVFFLHSINLVCNADLIISVSVFRFSVNPVAIDLLLLLFDWFLIQLSIRFEKNRKEKKTNSLKNLNSDKISLVVFFGCLFDYDNWLIWLRQHWLYLLLLLLSLLLLLLSYWTIILDSRISRIDASSLSLPPSFFAFCISIIINFKDSFFSNIFHRNIKMTVYKCPWTSWSESCLRILSLSLSLSLYIAGFYYQNHPTQIINNVTIEKTTKKKYIFIVFCHLLFALCA